MGKENSSPNGNARVIAALLADLDALGVEEFCVAAGARNAPLLSVLMERAEDSNLTVRHFFEERCASFFALGRVMDGRNPVAVVTTSGTAVAELFPAVMEAYYQAAPLILVTADRPSRFRGSGAPQAVEQENFFGTYAVRTVEMEVKGDGRIYVDDASTTASGPVHYNICLEETFDGAGDNYGTPAVQMNFPLEPTEVELQAWHEFWQGEGQVVVLAGGIHPEEVQSVRNFLLKLKAPIVAEATANLHDDPDLVPWLMPASEQTLQGLAPGRVLRIGSVPSWRWWRDLEDSDVPVLNVSQAPFPGLARSQNVSLVPWDLLRVPFETESCPVHPVATDRLCRLLEENPSSEPAWMRHLSRMIGPGSTVLLGNSLPIREWNLAASPARGRTRFFANRGANGIDGLVSTWLGLSARAAESWLIVGDLSTLYDLSAPWILSQLPKGKRRIVIINNGGGKIFSRVSWLKKAGPEARKVMENAHELNFEPWAQMWGMDYRRFTDCGALQDDEAGCAVWEVRPDEVETTRFWQGWQTVS